MQFTDAQGRTWNVGINVVSLERVRDLTGTDLLDDVGPALERMGRSVRLTVDVLYAVVKPQADAAGVSDVDFGEGLSGQAIASGYDHLLRGLVDFFQWNPTQHRVMKKAMEKSEQLQAKTIAYLEAKLESPELDRMLERELDALSARAFTDSPDGSASTPAP